MCVRHVSHLATKSLTAIRHGRKETVRWIETKYFAYLLEEEMLSICLNVGNTQLYLWDFISW